MTPPDRLRIADVMLVALADEIRNGDVVGVGVGTPLALAAVMLARATHAPGAHVLAGGVLDASVDLATYSRGASATVGHTPGFISHFESMDMAERQAMTLQFLRPAQVDGRGNLNTSRIGARRSPSVRFPGGLATADVPSLLPRLVAYIPGHQTRSLPREVSYLTGQGEGWSDDTYSARGVVTLVTDLAVFRFGAAGATLASIHEWTTIDEVLSKMEFRVAIPDSVPVSPEPNGAQRDVLIAIDGRGSRNIEIRARARAKKEARN